MSDHIPDPGQHPTILNGQSPIASGAEGIDDSRFPHRYLIDYVRIYQQK